ncbi:dual specificity protein phosphatase 13-like [Megalops cyprinoides]|uniref:dual specificity protein phosphatase 13-like n=1 Tax=Megalops cyprinoides TaxID=118141 RepID=UPI0018646877|nr:dual specificity protein phosphatase 13-like [Megalops cyprinoides]
MTDHRRTKKSFNFRSDMTVNDGGARSITKHHFSCNDCERATARDKAMLSGLGITHIVNAADGPRRINTGARFYDGMTVEYHGVEAADHPAFDLSPFFHPTAEFIREALSQKGKCERASRGRRAPEVFKSNTFLFTELMKWKVLVHCAMGVSRSATLVLAFLMICEDLTLVEAINAVRKHRHVCPNEGFLNQLRHLDSTLAQERSIKQVSYDS